MIAQANYRTYFIVNEGTDNNKNIRTTYSMLRVNFFEAFVFYQTCDFYLLIDSSTPTSFKCGKSR